MAGPPHSRSKNDVARDLIAWHFHVEPDLETVYLLHDGDDREDEPIKLLEVNLGASYSGRVDAYFFDPAGDITYPSEFAEVSRKEFEMIRAGVLALPEGWSLEGAALFHRDDVTPTKHAKVAG
jgi:hypothetical protein